jgi:tRNA 2-thiouridine synthesizing protein C
VPSNAKNSLLVVVRHSPYGSSVARSSLEVALAAAAFEQPVGLLFVGDGVLQLIPDQEPSGIGVRNIAKLIQSLPLYDIETLYADEQALQRYGLDPQTLPQQLLPLNTAAIQALFSNYDHILSF